ncbi:MAG TPA: hypothetical protein VII58_12340 [Acidobacteriaceae bacterium]
MPAAATTRSILLLASLAAPAVLCAQQGFGPLDPAPPTGRTADEIVQNFGEQETAFQRARDSYTFRQSVKVDTIDDDTGKVDGEYQQVSNLVFDKDGKRMENVIFAPQNTLQRVMMSPTDFDEIEHRLPFILTTADQPLYDIKYLGRQKVDDLDTYVFNVGPKQIAKGKHYFQGKVWVDQQDLEIVMVNGTTVPQDLRPGHEDLQPPFTTYYEQVDGKYWFPTYTKAEGILRFAGQNGALPDEVHMRSIVKFTDYKQFHATSRILYDGEDITDKKAPDAGQPAGQATPPKKK